MYTFHLIDGEFIILSYDCGCGESKGSKYQFITNDKTLDLAFEDDRQALVTPVNIPISLSISKEPLSGGCYLVNPDEIWYFKLPIDAYVKDEYINGKIKKHIALITAIRFTEESNPTEFQKSKKRVEKWAKITENFYRTYAGHKWDVRCEPFLITSECYPTSPEFCSFEYETWAKENTDKIPEGFFPNYFHWIGGASKFCGLARLSGHASATYPDGVHVCGVHTVIHEVGHNFGLMHANMKMKLLSWVKAAVQ